MDDKNLKLITTLFSDGTPQAQYLASDLIKIADKYGSNYRDWAIQYMSPEEWDRQYELALTALLDGRLVKVPAGYKFTDGTKEKIHPNVLSTLTSYLGALKEYTPEKEELPSNAELFSEYVAKPLALNNPDEIKNYMPGGIHHSNAGTIISNNIKKSIFPKVKGTDREKFWDDFVAELERNGIGDADISFANRLGDKSSGQFLKAISGKKENLYLKQLLELKLKFINQGFSELEAEQYAKEDLTQQLDSIKKLRHQNQLKIQKAEEEQQKAQQEKEWLASLYDYYKLHWFKQNNYTNMYVKLPEKFELDLEFIKKYWNIFRNMDAYMFGDNPPNDWDSVPEKDQEKLKQTWVYTAFIKNASKFLSGKDGSILYLPSMFRPGSGVINVYDVNDRKFYTLNDINNPVLQDVMKKWYETQKPRPTAKNPFMKNGGLIKKCEGGDTLTTGQVLIAQEVFSDDQLAKSLGLNPTEANKYRPVSNGSYLPMRGVDLLRGAATAGDLGLATTSIVAPGVGNLVAPIGGVVTTGMHWLADGLDDNVSREEMWKNLAINAGLTGALLIPGGGSARLVKVAKTTKDAAKAAKALKWAKRLRTASRVAQGGITAAGASYGIAGFNLARDIFSRYVKDPKSVTQDEFRFLTNWLSVVSGTSINTQLLSTVAARHFGDNNIGRMFNIVYDPVSIFSAKRRHVNNAVLRGFAKNTVEGGYDFINIDGKRYRISPEALQEIGNLLSLLKNSSKTDKLAILNQILGIVKEDITGINAEVRNDLKNRLKNQDSFTDTDGYSHEYKFDNITRVFELDGVGLLQLKDKTRGKTDTEIDGIIKEWIAEKFASDINWPKATSNMINHEPATEAIDFNDPNNEALLHLLHRNSRARNIFGISQTPENIGQDAIVNTLRERFGLQVSGKKDIELLNLYNSYLENKLGLDPWNLYNLEKLKYLDDIQETDFKKFRLSALPPDNVPVDKKGGSINPLKGLRQNFTIDTTKKFSRGGIVKADGGTLLNNWYTNLWRHKQLKGWTPTEDSSYSGNLSESQYHNKSGDIRAAFDFNLLYTNSDKVGSDIQNYYNTLNSDDSLITDELFIQNYNEKLKEVNSRFDNEITYGSRGAELGNIAHKLLYASLYDKNNPNIYLSYNPDVIDIWGSTSWLRRGDKYETELLNLTPELLKKRTFKIKKSDGSEFTVYKKANGELTLTLTGKTDNDVMSDRPQGDGNQQYKTKDLEIDLEDHYLDPYTMGLQKAYPDLLDLSRYLKNLRNNKRILELGLKKGINLKDALQLHRNTYGRFDSLTQHTNLANLIRSKANDIAGLTINTEAGAATQLEGELKAQQQESIGRNDDNQMIRLSSNESQQMEENLYKYNKEVAELNMDKIVANKNYKLDIESAKESADTTNYNNFSMAREQRARQEAANLKEKIEKIRLLRLELDKQDYLTNTPKIKELYNQLYSASPEDRLKILDQIEEYKRLYQSTYGPYFFNEYIRILLGDYSRGRLPSEVQIRTPKPTIPTDTDTRKTGGKLYNHSIKKKGEDLKELRKLIRHNITTNQKALDNLSKSTLLELKKMMDI